MKRCVALAVCASVLSGLPGVASAESRPVREAFLDMPLKSAYVTRGRCLNDEAVLQPSLTARRDGFAISWWGNLNLTDRLSEDAYEFIEHDVYVRYITSCPLTGAEASLGLITYDFPNVNYLRDAEGNVIPIADSQEIAFTYGFPKALLEPNLEVFYDYKEANGFYVRMNVGHPLSLGGKALLMLSASLAGASDNMADFAFPGSEGGITDAKVAAHLPIPLADHAWLAPGLTYIALLGDARDLVKSNDFFYFGKEELLIASLTLRYNF